MTNKCLFGSIVEGSFLSKHENILLESRRIFRVSFLIIQKNILNTGCHNVIQHLSNNLRSLFFKLSLYCHRLIEFVFCQYTKNSTYQLISKFLQVKVWSKHQFNWFKCLTITKLTPSVNPDEQVRRLLVYRGS